MKAPTLARSLLIVITALVVFIYYAPLGHADYVGRWGDGTYGIVAPRGALSVVDDVEAASPASRAGIHAGDRLVEASPTERSALVFPRAGERATFHFQRRDGTTYRATLTAVPVSNFGWWDRLGGVLAILPSTIFLIVAFALVYVRPSVMTWAFFVYSVGYFSTGPSFEYFRGVLPDPIYTVMSFALGTAFGSFAVMPLIPFVLRFPNNDMQGWRKKIETPIWILLGLAYGAYVYEWWYGYVNGTPPHFAALLDSWLPLAAFAIAAAIVVKNFKTATPDLRQRMSFLVVGVIVSFAAYAVYFVPSVPFAVGQIVGYAATLMPICVAYAVLRHRVLDVNFVLNRAIAYGVLSVLVIAFISMLDWLASRVVSIEHFATVVELGVTIAIGFLLDRINRVVGNFVESVLFRKRHQAERYLQRVATALPYATGEDAVTDGLVHEPVDALELTAGALYRRSDDGRHFDGIATSDETLVAPPGFDADHNLVRFLKAEEDVVWLHELRAHLDPENSAIYVLAIPVLVRHQLESFALYGAHRNGAQIDPDEVKLLKELAREAARAYDHVEAVRMRELLARASLTLETQ
jgi:hypothetical protein